VARLQEEVDEPMTETRARSSAHPASRRGPLIAVAIVVVVVVVVIAAFFAVRASTASHSAQSDSLVGAPAPVDVVQAVTHVPTSALDAVGFNSSLVSPLKPLSGEPALSADGKPEVLYIGADYCPYCAAERWGLIVALSRFGTFTNLHLMRSSATDVYANTPTFTFYGSSYHSRYLSFVPVELQTRTYQTLQKPTPSEQALLTRLDAPPYVPSPQYDGSIPFVDVGGRYLDIGASYSPQLLDGLTWQTIAASLRDPSTQPAQAIDSLANEFTAAFCSLTHGQPESVCHSPVIEHLRARL
jgi:thiol-disulfide isomerase/thioredoxin